ncbi:MATE family efflux transporter [Algiphilus sp.]|uniref:MATE family efflux transporter n=1 Tax=Algiphilus sp. TaxID=1872431 RepID=UPI003B521107
MLAAAYRQELVPFLRTALPIIGAQLAFMGMGVVDTIFAGRLGGQALAAVAVGSHVWMPVFMFFLGVLMAVSPIVAYRIGARENPAETGVMLRGQLLLAGLLGLVWMALLWTVGSALIAQTGLQPETATLARDYLRAESFACVAFACVFVLRYGVEGTGRTAAVLWISVLGFVVNAVFDGIFMFGWGPVPAMGAVGCGWATVVAVLVMLACWLLLYARSRPLAAFALFRWQWPGMPWAHWLSTLRLGLPIGCILIAEAGLFAAATLFMAAFGDTVVAAHQVAINFAALAFMVPLGFGFAATVRVGQAMGAGDAHAAALRGRMAIALGFLFSLMSATFMALFPESIARWYTDDVAVVQVAAHLLAYAAAFQLFDCLQATANGALRGLKDTRGPMQITVTAYWLVGMPLAWTAAFVWDAGPDGLWWGLIAGLAVAAFGLVTRFLRASRSLKSTSDPAATRH